MATDAKGKGPDPLGRALELVLALGVGAMGGRIAWRGFAEGMDSERILGGAVMLTAAIALGVHSIRRGRKSGKPPATA